MKKYPRKEVEKAVEALHSIRDRASAGEIGWEALADLFTEDATYIDPAWGRFKGRENIRRFLRDSMQGLKDWKFPTEWHVIEGNRVISRFLNRLPGQRADGTYYDVPGVSIIEYAGGGKFSYEEDIINMVHLYEVLQESGWVPGPDMKLPQKVVR
ncbi:MAG: nuclear transport factor 2 family protein [Dehalococcoidia bacterium]|nr:nuclear transport factor 2 family protein [Dehalococcoidia bacterium]